MFFSLEKRRTREEEEKMIMAAMDSVDRKQLKHLEKLLNNKLENNKETKLEKGEKFLMQLVI